MNRSYISDHMRNSTTSWENSMIFRLVFKTWYWISGELSDCISEISSIFSFCWSCDLLLWYDSINGKGQFLAGWCSPEQMQLADQLHNGIFPHYRTQLWLLVYPIDNRNVLHVTVDRWHMTGDRWHGKGDAWQVKHDTWHIVWGEHSLKISAL